MLFEKACVSFVVRKTNEDGVADEDSELLGDVYVHGIMKAEVMALHDFENSRRDSRITVVSDHRARFPLH